MAKHTKKFYFISFILVTVIFVNLYFLYKNYQLRTLTFTHPVTEGSILKNSVLKSSKELLIVFLKPDCSSCSFFEEHIKHLYSTYNGNLDFLGLCNSKYWNAEYINGFEFEFKKVDNELRKQFHLAITPQIILVENNRITFATDFNKSFPDEFQRLTKYLQTKYHQNIKQ